MRFDELNESNYIMFAIKHYENPQAVTQEDFYDDMKRKLPNIDIGTRTSTRFRKIMDKLNIFINI